jgi:hypothetical protein
LEHHAVGIKTLQTFHIPGLLQTEAYMRAIHTYATPEPPPDYVEQIVHFRMQRRRVLDRQPSPPLVAVVHEAALRTKVGDLASAREQLGFLLESAERPEITLRVVPFDVEGFAGSGYSMLFLEGPVPQLDTVQLDTAHGSIFLDAEAELDSYRALFNKVTDAALPAAKSRELIHSIAKEI